MNISEVKVWANGKWSVFEDKQKYNGWCDSMLSGLFLKIDVAVCSYCLNDKVISEVMHIVKRKNNSELWFNSDSTAELTQIVNSGLNFTLLMYDNENVESLMLTGKMEIEENEDIKKEIWKEEFGDWYFGGVPSEDCAVIHFQAEEYRVFNNVEQIELKK